MREERLQKKKVWANFGPVGFLSFAPVLFRSFSPSLPHEDFMRRVKT
jgi:hypothetical protein